MEAWDAIAAGYAATWRPGGGLSSRRCGSWG